MASSSSEALWGCSSGCGAWGRGGAGVSGGAEGGQGALRLGLELVRRVPPRPVTLPALRAAPRVTHSPARHPQPRASPTAPPAHPGPPTGTPAHPPTRGLLGRHRGQVLPYVIHGLGHSVSRAGSLGCRERRVGGGGGDAGVAQVGRQPVLRWRVGVRVRERVDGCVAERRWAHADVGGWRGQEDEGCAAAGGTRNRLAAAGRLGCPTHTNTHNRLHSPLPPALPSRTPACTPTHPPTRTHRLLGGLGGLRRALARRARRHGASAAL